MSEQAAVQRPGLLERMTPARIVALAVLGSIPAKLLTERISDPDLWWHLRTGRLIVATHRVPSVDPYSYTAGGKPWVVQEWGSEVFLYGLKRALGLWGILAFRAVALLIVYLIVARLLSKRMGSGMGTWALLGLTAYAGAANWTERPNLLSFILFALTLTLVHRHDRAIWWFVPMAALWTNLHGMVIVGIGLVAIVGASEGLKAWLGWQGADGAWARRLGFVSIAGLAASLLNPAGPELLVHVVRLVRVVRDVVTEWASPNFHDAGALVFLVLILVAVAALALSSVRADLTDVVLLLAFSFLALQAVRNLAMCSIVLGYVAAGYLPGAVGSFRTRARERKEVGGGSSKLLGAMGLTMAIGGLGILVAAGLPRSDAFADIVDKRYPLEAIEALDVPGVRVFTYDFFSGLVIDVAWPNAHVYTDLRTDFFGLALSRRYQRTIAGFPDALGNLDASCTTHVLIRRKDQLSGALGASSSWTLVREDKRSLIFERRAPAPGCERYPIPHVHPA